MGIARRTATAGDYAAPSTPENGPNDALPEESEETPDRSSSVVKRGWDAAKQKIEANSTNSYAEDWTPPLGETLLKFLEDEPFAAVGQHWVSEITDGKRSFNCPEDGCPLCAVGHRARPLVFFNVTPININGTAQDPKVVALKAGPMLTDLIQTEHEGRGGPLSRHYWVLRRKETQQGKSKKTEYSLSLVKERDLVDDFEMDAEAVKSSLSGLSLYDESIISVSKVSDLEDVVRTHLSND